jgi:glycosyltransferase involved in cell wall biosynthesis
VESTPFVSIVTPFYNTRKFLSECIESVLLQTYENWEYVLVDNCSTDGSSEVAAEYSSRFPNKIRLIHTESFLSQVQNYNFALSCISPSSRYCKMVQADDWLFPDCIRSMVEVSEAHPSVGIVAAYQLEGDDVHLDGLSYPSTEVPGGHVCRLYFLRDTYVFGSPTSLLMRSDLVRARNPFYDQRYAPFEDGHACFDLLRTCNFGFVHQVLTYSRSDNGGILSGVCQFGLKPFLHFSMLVAHGKDYLSREEYDYCFKGAERSYFVHLTKAACTLRPESREFWEFHRNGLASINYRLGWRSLWKWIPRAVLEKTWDSFWRTCDRASRPELDNGRTYQQQRTTG